MDEKILHTCCFFGHRRIHETEDLKNKLCMIIENLIRSEKVDTFFFGSNSEFDTLSLKTVTELKAKYPHIRRIYVRSSFPDISDSYETYLLKSYEETFYPVSLHGAGKASYVKRNQEMIHRSRFCVIYYDENYIPPKQKGNTPNVSNVQPKSGTKVAYAYAVQKKRAIINVLSC